MAYSNCAIRSGSTPHYSSIIQCNKRNGERVETGRRKNCSCVAKYPTKRLFPRSIYKCKRSSIFNLFLRPAGIKGRSHPKTVGRHGGLSSQLPQVLQRHLLVRFDKSQHFQVFLVTVLLPLVHVALHNGHKRFSALLQIVVTTSLFVYICQLNRLIVKEKSQTRLGRKK